MNPFTPHLEEAFKLLRDHMRSTDPRVSIRACRTIIAADLRYRMLEYTAVRAEYAALKHQHTAPTAPSAPPTDPPDAPASSGAPRTAQSAPRQSPPRFDELREELRLAPEHRELVATAIASSQPTPDPIPSDPPATITAATRQSIAAQLAGSAGASITLFAPAPLPPYPRASHNTT